MTRGSKSRNKVSVGEPAEGSVTILSLALASNLNSFEIENWTRSD